MRTLDPRKWRFKPPVWLVFILKQTVGRVYSALNFRPEEDIGIARHTLARMEHRFGRDNRITVNGMESLARRLGDDGQPIGFTTLGSGPER